MMFALLFAGVWVIAVVLVLSLCRAAAMADRNVPTPPRPPEDDQ